MREESEKTAEAKQSSCLHVGWQQDTLPGITSSPQPAHKVQSSSLPTHGTVLR